MRSLVGPKDREEVTYVDPIRTHAATIVPRARFVGPRCVWGRVAVVVVEIYLVRWRPGVRDVIVVAATLAELSYQISFYANRTAFRRHIPVTIVIPQHLDR